MKLQYKMNCAIENLPSDCSRNVAASLAGSEAARDRPDAPPIFLNCDRRFLFFRSRVGCQELSHFELFGGTRGTRQKVRTVFACVRLYALQVPRVCPRVASRATSCSVRSRDVVAASTQFLLLCCVLLPSNDGLVSGRRSRTVRRCGREPHPTRARAGIRSSSGCSDL